MITLSTLPLAAGKNADFTPSDIAALLEQYNAAANGFGPIATFAAPVGGSGYVNGTFTGVALVGGKGYQATANITVAGNTVTAVAVNHAGVGYAVGDVLTAALVGGSGFSIAVATVTATTVGVDAVTAAFASTLFAYVTNRFGVMSELTIAASTAYIAPGSPSVVAEEDQYKNPAAELVNTTNPSGVASTPENSPGVVIQS